jgi:hypothetical protein
VRGRAPTSLIQEQAAFDLGSIRVNYWEDANLLASSESLKYPAMPNEQPDYLKREAERFRAVANRTIDEAQRRALLDAADACEKQAQALISKN